ncbi:tetratricopeptide repeat protein [Streptomyces misionensis]|uniref:Tetratricopeptide repeat protein n=1 Tax=Streptomyces misionensis TaxID=67331 RepID=A0A5C6J4D8_9ACTN|nr:DUF6571 family protein [Streptomyces misionensis]TWV36124.1 tetratricopeptide repeat protein [Streptomyces misionensis]
MDLNVLLHGDFAALGQAISDWDSLTKRLETLERDARDNLKAKATRARWAGVNATVTREFVAKTADEFTDAHTQAQSVANILRDTREELISYRDHLQEVIENARKKNLTVVDDGCGMFHVQMIVHPDRAAKGTTVPEHTETDEELLREEVKRVLTKATESDSTAAHALKSLVDSVEEGFADSAYGDRDQAVAAEKQAVQDKKDAEQAARLYSRLDSLSDEELKQLAELTEKGKNSPVFASELVKNLDYRGRDGQEALLLLSQSLTGGGRDGRDSTAERRLREALSTSLATATRPGSPLGPNGGTPSEWTEKLLRTAREGNGLPAQHPGSLAGGATGLGLLTKLMGSGSAVYDSSLLTATGDEIRDYETHTKHPYEGIADNWKGTQEDPMSGLMKAMARNPEAAESYFDPHRNDNLDYFLKRRDWPGGDVENKMPQDLIDSSARHYLGDALEAASTGHAPGIMAPAIPARHDPAQAAVFSGVVSAYGQGIAGDPAGGMPAGLRHSMGGMMADYVGDVHQILGQDRTNPTDYSGLDVKAQDLVPVIRAMAEDGTAFAKLHDAETSYVAQELDKYDGQAFVREDAPGAKELKAFVGQSNMALGQMDAVRADVIYQMGEDKKSVNAWNKMMQYHVIGAPVTGIPLAGDTIQRLVDVGTAEYQNNLNAEVDKETRQNLAGHFSAGHRQIDAMLERAVHSKVPENQWYLMYQDPGQFERGLQKGGLGEYNDGLTLGVGSMGKPAG